MRMEWQRFLPLLIVYNAASLCYEFCLFYGLSGTLDGGIRICNGDIFTRSIVYFYLLLSMFFNILTPFFWITGTFIDT